MKNLILRFGAMTPTIEKQLQEQGHPIPHNIAVFEDGAKAITSLYLRAILTEAEAHKAKKRLMNQINFAIAEVEEEAKL